MKHPRSARLTTCLLALATIILAAAGCDWLKPSGSESRSSPVIDDLRVIPSLVDCGDPDNDEGDRNEIAISFSYSDPQDDFFQVLLTFEHTESGERIERSAIWSGLDFTANPGKATYDEFFFECGLYPEGDWTLTVRVEDELGHFSNELTAVLDLVTAD